MWYWCNYPMAGWWWVFPLMAVLCFILMFFFMRRRFGLSFCSNPVQGAGGAGPADKPFSTKMKQVMTSG